MRLPRVLLPVLLAGAASLTLVAPSAGGPAPKPRQPSAMILGSWDGTTMVREEFSYPNSYGDWAGTVHTAGIAIPAGGAWLTGQSSFDEYGGWDCAHHFRGTLVPNSSSFDPLFRLGRQGYQACVGSLCFGCRINWDGIDDEAVSTENNPAFLSPLSATLELRSEAPPTGPNQFFMALGQFNCADMDGLRLYQALAVTDARERYEPGDGAVAYLADSSDRVPIVPVLQFGAEEFPACPGTTFEVAWDREPSHQTWVAPGTQWDHQIIPVEIPDTLKTGNHTINVTAHLPGGAMVTGAIKRIFVYNAVP